ncbi:MAG: AAA family ATPase [Dehalococcoidia bacterium]|nr:AAA family ATPase [Dehalococcoidia bacterium]
MRLKKIELKNFKRLVDFQAQFSPGINVVKGPLNEMGKSTLLEGIVVALFHNPRSTAKGLKDYVSWGLTRQFRTSLEFEDKGNRYLLEKDFDKGTARLTSENGREEFDTFKEISEKMAELLGTKSDTLFLCSSCIRQDQVSEISSGKKEINESLEEIVSGGKESILASQVMQKLDDRISEIRKGLDRPAKIKGSLALLRDQRDEFLRKYREVRDEVAKIEARKIELVEMDKKLAEVKEQYENAKVLLDKNKQRKEIEASIKDLKQKYDEVEELLGGVNGLMTRLEAADEALRSVEGLENEQQVSEFRKGLDAIQYKRGDTEKDLAMRGKELAEAKEKLERKRSQAFFGSGRSIAVPVTMIIIGVIGALVVHLYSLGLTILGAALLVITVIRERTAFIREEISIADLEMRLQKMKEALGGLTTKQSELLAGAKCRTVGEFDKKEKDFKSWIAEKGSLEAQLKGMLRGKTVEDFQKQKQKIARDLAVEEAKLTDDLKATALSTEQYIELEKRVRSLEVRQAELEKQRRRCEVIIEQARFNIENQIGLEEELKGIHEALRHEEKKVKVYGLAREFISKARTEILSSAGEALEKEIQRYLAIFTDGKYKQVKVNKEALEFRVYSDEKRDWAKPEELSGGVIDEFYLAFRVALAKLIFGDKKPPLILDDPFVNFDSVRLDRTLDFFKTLASDYQIIIFALSDSYDRVADNIVLLGKKERQCMALQQIEGKDFPKIDLIGKSGNADNVIYLPDNLH